MNFNLGETFKFWNDTPEFIIDTIKYFILHLIYNTGRT